MQASPGPDGAESRTDEQSRDSVAFNIGPATRVGNITVQGDVAGRDIIKMSEELAYNVSDLSSNPYLGLASYTYEERAFFGGRSDQVREVVDRLTSRADPPVLVFVTGASGSGKSSFVQAGLIPALSTAYEARRLSVRWSIARPGRNPLAVLARALMEIGCSSSGTGDLVAALSSVEDLNAFLATHTPPGQVNVLVLDQFEELFTQSEPIERTIVCALLAGMADFARIHTHVLVTLRADYLASLFDVPALFDRIKADGVELRAMRSDELARAIEQPLHEEAQREHRDKRIDPALVQKLTADVGQDPTLLPLLQVTLRSLWDEPPHKLVVARYTSLTDALEKHADQVLSFDAQGHPRSDAERASIMDILVELVQVSLDEDARRDVRRTVARSELVADHPERAALVDQLVAARLLSTSVQQRGQDTVDVVDLIHETLLREWTQLRDEIAARRRARQRGERFRMAVQDWLKHDKSEEYLLDGVRLAEARQLSEAGDLSTRPPPAQELIAQSIDKQEQAHRRELEQAHALAEAERQRADVERHARRRQVVFSSVILAIAFTLAVVAGVAFSLRGQADAARIRAETQQALATSRALALRASAELPTDPQQSLVLATQAALTGPTTDAEDALRQALLQSHVRAVLTEPSGATDAAFSPDGSLVATAAQQGPVRVWDGATGAQLAQLGEARANAAIAFSHDGRLVGSASFDGTTHIWDRTNPSLLTTLSGHQGSVLGIEFSPDDRRVLTASTDGTAAIWDTATGLRQVLLQGHLAALTHAHFDHAGNRVATASQDGTARVWDAQTGQLLSTFDEHGAAVDGLAFSPDGQRLATANHDHLVRVYDLSRPGSVAVLRGHSDGAVTVAFAPDGNELVSASLDGTAIIWRSATGEQLHVLTGHTGALSAAEFSPDGARVLTSSADGTARIWDAGTGKQLALLRGHTGNVIKATFSAAGVRVLTVGDTTARVWEPTADQELVALTGFRDAVASLAFSPDGKLLLAGDADGTAQVWDTTSWTSVAKLVEHTDAILSTSFDATGDAALTASLDGTAVVWDTRNWQVLQRLATRAGPLTCAKLSPDGQKVVTANRDGSLWIWDARAGSSRRLMPGTPAPVTGIAFDPSGASFTTVAADGSAVVWDASTGAQRMLDGHSDWITSVAADPFSEHVVTTSADSTAKVWDIRQSKLTAVLQGHAGMLTEAAFSPDGARLVTSSVDGSARLWSLADPSTSIELNGHRLAVWSAVFDPSGKLVLTAGDDGTARLWDSASGSPISTLPGHTGPVTSAVFSPDGRYIATAGRDAIVQIHLSRLADLVVLAVKGLGPVSPSRLSAAGLQDLQSRMPSASDRTAVAEPDLSDVHPPPLLVAGTVAQPPAISCADAVYWKPVGAAHPRLGCATVASTTDSTYRQYERGWMIWRKSPSPSQVYVLTQSPRGNRWQAFQDYSTDPEVARTPGQGCPEYERSGGKPPVGEFDTVWCEPWNWKLPLGKLLKADAQGGGNLVQQFQHGVVLSLQGGPGLVLYDDHTWDQFNNE